ncbi:hypothetical protein [Virgibacillus halodenitrificans]|jgi:hypothetical protein|uniref:Hydrolase n=1 Tax=Virgibacillus halodenitrificans TaxID=1482 RepID=A0AAC9J171_VIRHA|nr:hypothetical protein [Virgibacillus halodenitrificans]APC48642.1 hypothetical protein BME96_10805 [Virgibacillus halodenitrificans]MCG1028690.1 hypothetical protein [Virgibacillus halodenitrificans]MCJ0931217.1 hypothetical protein [Virgibacillus halodenitrificans]MEC2160288.1 hypothetical protein [Virgibacillus halodenitrificans]MYL45951.1 hypothetical protein [Virgibacillus halodenitrificans]
MADRKHYFVTVDTQDIREVSLPGSGIEYEIIADHNEIEQLNELFMKKDKNEKKAMSFLAKPFDEWGADDERNAYDDHMMRIFQMLYELGTDDTKTKIYELGIINR